MATMRIHTRKWTTKQSEKWSLSSVPAKSWLHSSWMHLLPKCWHTSNLHSNAIPMKSKKKEKKMKWNCSTKWCTNNSSKCDSCSKDIGSPLYLLPKPSTCIHCYNQTISRLKTLTTLQITTTRIKEKTLFNSALPSWSRCKSNWMWWSASKAATTCSIWYKSITWRNAPNARTARAASQASPSRRVSHSPSRKPISSTADKTWSNSIRCTNRSSTPL